MSQNATPASQASTQEEASKPNLQLAGQRNRHRRCGRRRLRGHLLDLGHRRRPRRQNAHSRRLPNSAPSSPARGCSAAPSAGCLIRKPGAALFGEIVAAVISVLLTGGAWSGDQS